jgi:HNH endonuclease
MHTLLNPATSLGRVEAHVRRRWRQRQRVDLDLCLGLRRLFRDNVHRGKGIGNFATYAEAEFEIPARQVWTFSLLGEHLERLPGLVSAMASGELSYTKAREFAPYIEPEHVDDWVAFARLNTSRVVEQKVARWNAERRGEEFVQRKKVTSSLNGLEAQAVRAAREKLLKTTAEFIPESQLLPRMAALFVEGRLNTAEGGLLRAGRLGRGSEPYLAIGLCAGCLATWVPVAGANMPVAAFEFLDRMRKGGEVTNLVPHYLCDCEGAVHRRDECPRGGGAGNGRGAEVEARGEESAASRYVSAGARRLIEARDGFRCSVPGCLNQLPLEGGHIRPFSEGGPNTAKNMATQCKACNALIEEGRLRVVGAAPFEKYYRGDGDFLGWGFDPTPFGARGLGESRRESLSHVGRGGEAGEVKERGAIWGLLALT